MAVDLDRPIFVVGHARGGSTLLAGILNWHSHVGPRYEEMANAPSAGAFLSSMLGHCYHLNYSEKMEQKEIWFTCFPGRSVFLHMGLELIAEHAPADATVRADLISRLTEDFRETRFLLKAPTNTFRVKAIRQLFPDARIVAVVRRGEDVVASWGRRHYGFGKPVDWGDTRIAKMSFGRGISIFTRKWRETLDYALRMRREGLLEVFSYRSLARDPQGTLARITGSLELPYEEYLDTIKIQPSAAKWKHEIPLPYRLLLRGLTFSGNRRIQALEAGP